MSGQLAQNLRKLVRFASKHIYECRLCSQKGFICEICNSPQVIYAFETDTTERVRVQEEITHGGFGNGNPLFLLLYTAMPLPQFGLSLLFHLGINEINKIHLILIPFLFYLYLGIYDFV